MATNQASSATILVVVDLAVAGPQPVLGRAAWLAERMGSSLELFAADYDADVDKGRVAAVALPQPGAREQLLLQHRRSLEALAKPLRERGIDVVVNVAWGYPLDETVVKRAAASRPWLVAKDTHHHSLAQRTLLSNVDWHLIRDCPVPLLLVKDRTIARKPIVLAAIDPVHEHDKPAQLDDALYRFAMTISEISGGELHLVHAVSTPLGVELPPNVRGLISAEHRRAMASFLTSHPVQGERVHMQEGLPNDCLLQTARAQNADFVVMGAVSRSGIKKVLIGSTAARVLDRMPCDIVIIKPAELVVPAGALRESAK